MVPAVFTGKQHSKLDSSVPVLKDLLQAHTIQNALIVHVDIRPCRSLVRMDHGRFALRYKY